MSANDITYLRFPAAMSSISSLEWAKAQPVSLQVLDEDGRIHSFATLRPFLTAHSGYFRNLFGGPWSDSQKSVIRTYDHPPWVVASIVSWLYTQDLTLTGYPGKPDWTVDSAAYRIWFQLYYFCEYYDIPLLRTIIIKMVQLRMNRSSVLKLTEFPSETDVAWLVEKMPFESLLLRAVDFVFRALRKCTNDNIFNRVPSTAKLFKGVAARHIWDCKMCIEIFAPERRLARDAGAHMEPCRCPLHSEAQMYETTGVNVPRAWCLLHHEHATDEEQILCQSDSEDLVRKIASKDER